MHREAVLKAVKEYAYLRRVILEITERCNLNCNFCYLPEKRPSAEISRDKLFNIGHELKTLGCNRVALIGGEPLCRGDFPDIYSYFHNLGFLIKIDTNGSLISSRIAELFRRYSPEIIKISIYATDGATYKKLTGKNKIFEAVFRGIENLKKYNVKFILHFVITKETASEAYKMERLAKDYSVPYIVTKAKNFKFPCREEFGVYHHNPDSEILSKLKEYEEGVEKYKLCFGRLYITNKKILLCPIKRTPGFEYNNRSIKEILSSIVEKDIEIICPFSS